MYFKKSETRSMLLYSLFRFHEKETTMDNDENKKIDPSSEEYNRQLLKQTAFTFSREGISEDLKFFVQKKVSHNKTNLCYVTQLMDLAVNSSSNKVIDMVSSKSSPIRKLLEHVSSEIIKTDALLDRSIDFVINKDPSFKDIKG